MDFDEIGTVTHIGPYRGQTVKISKFWKSKLAAVAILKITEIVIFTKFCTVIQNGSLNRSDCYKVWISKIYHLRLFLPLDALDYSSGWYTLSLCYVFPANAVSNYMQPKVQPARLARLEAEIALCSCYTSRNKKLMSLLYWTPWNVSILLQFTWHTVIQDMHTLRMSRPSSTVCLNGPISTSRISSFCKHNIFYITKWPITSAVHRLDSQTPFCHMTLLVRACLMYYTVSGKNDTPV